MFGLDSLELYTYFLLFIIAIFFSWFIPGWVSLTIVKIKNENLKFLLALPTGLSLWGIQAYLFGYAQIRFLTIAYILLFFYLFWTNQKTNNFLEFKKILISLKSQPKLLILLITISSCIQIYSHLGSGLVTSTGLPFYFVNSVDGVLHLSYIQELTNNFPPQEPGALGLTLSNYHYWSDLVQAELVRIWKVPTIHVFFQYAPLIISLWTTMLFVFTISYIGGNRKAQLVGLFLLTLGGDASYILTQILHKSWGANVSSLDSGVSFYFNIPQVYARFVFLSVVILCIEWWKKKTLSLGILLSLLVASLFGFKVYYALYSVFGFCFVTAWEIIGNFLTQLRKHTLISAIRKVLFNSKQQLIVILFLGFSCLTIYLPANSGAGGLTYSFFEWPKLLLSAVNIDYIDWFLRMQVYEAYNNYRNIFIFNMWAVFLTFIAVYGTRMIGILPLFKIKNDAIKNLVLFFIPTNIIFILLGLLTLQTSGGLNIFNFLIVPIFSFNIFTAITLSQLRTKYFIPIFVVFVLLTVPRSILQLNHFYQRYSTQNTDSFITNNELEAFAFLKKQEHAVVQTTLENHYNFQTPYVAFLSGHPTYIGGVSMLESHNQPVQSRVDAVSNALKQTDVNKKAELLANLGITHFIVQTKDLDQPNLWLAEKVFQNETVSILKLQ